MKVKYILNKIKSLILKKDLTLSKNKSMEHNLHSSTLKFLKNLTNNNDRIWFNNNKDLYLSAQDNFVNVVDDILQKLAFFDATMERLEGKNTTFRIYRDIRFSKDKTPYKTHLSASLGRKGGKTLNYSGYYIHLEPGKSFVAGGVYQTESANLKMIREKISDLSTKFLEIVNAKPFKDNLQWHGEQLKRVPQGFDKDNPMADYLRYKQLIVSYSLKDEQVLSDHFVDDVAKICKIIYPLNQFLASALED